MLCKSYSNPKCRTLVRSSFVSNTSDRASFPICMPLGTFLSCKLKYTIPEPSATKHWVLKDGVPRVAVGSKEVKLRVLKSNVLIRSRYWGEISIKVQLLPPHLWLESLQKCMHVSGNPNNAGKQPQVFYNSVPKRKVPLILWKWLWLTSIHHPPPSKT